MRIVITQKNLMPHIGKWTHRQTQGTSVSYKWITSVRYKVAAYSIKRSRPPAGSYFLLK